MNAHNTDTYHISPTYELIRQERHFNKYLPTQRQKVLKRGHPHLCTLTLNFPLPLALYLHYLPLLIILTSKLSLSSSSTTCLIFTLSSCHLSFLTHPQGYHLLLSLPALSLSLSHSSFMRVFFLHSFHFNISERQIII